MARKILDEQGERIGRLNRFLSFVIDIISCGFQVQLMEKKAVQPGFFGKAGFLCYGQEHVALNDIVW